jgi:hypothetical protein
MIYYHMMHLGRKSSISLCFLCCRDQFVCENNRGRSVCCLSLDYGCSSHPSVGIRRDICRKGNHRSVSAIHQRDVGYFPLRLWRRVSPWFPLWEFSCCF